ncbi:hypothetical protein QZH41_018153, partial [Actinostola sp. cb2023]
VKYSVLAVSIYQALNVITRLESDERKPTPQQANSTLEKIELSIRKITETLKNAMGEILLLHFAMETSSTRTVFGLKIHLGIQHSFRVRYQSFQAHRHQGLCQEMAAFSSKNLIHRCFPAAQEGTIRCYELLCMHIGLVPVRLAAKHIRKLADALFESSLGAHYPISLLQ